MKARKKPVVVEVMQFTGGVANVDDVVSWADSLVRGEALSPFNCTIDTIYIDTLEGSMRADIGDWIICGVNGEFYPCKPDIFEKTYDLLLDEGN